MRAATVRERPGAFGEIRRADGPTQQAGMPVLLMSEAERQQAIWKKLARMAPGPHELAGSIPTGFRALDDALGGGFPCGGLLEFYGPVGCGKSTLTLQVVAKLQARALTCAWIDADRTFDSAYAESLGVAVD